MRRVRFSQVYSGLGNLTNRGRSWAFEWFPFWALPLLLLASAALGQTLRPSSLGLIAQPPPQTWASVSAPAGTRASRLCDPPERRDDNWPRHWQVSGAGHRWDARGTMTDYPGDVLVLGSVTAWAVTEGADGIRLDGPVTCAGPADFDCDGSLGTEKDIEALFACWLDPKCPAGDYDLSGSVDEGDIEAFFRCLSGAC